MLNDCRLLNDCRSNNLFGKVKLQSASDSGSAMLEFIVVGVAIIMPLVYLAIAVMTLHAGSFAAHAAAREAARGFIASGSVAEGNSLAIALMQQAFADHGVEAAIPTLVITCTGGPCLSPGSQVNANISSTVPLPLIPHWGEAAPLSFPVEASVTLMVDQFRQAG